MLFDIIWSLLVAILCISVFALFVWSVIKTETGKKIACFIVFFVILVIASGVLAENKNEADVKILSTEWTNEPGIIRVIFIYHGMKLSWYDDNPDFDDSLTYHVVLDGLRVIDAYPVED